MGDLVTIGWWSSEQSHPPGCEGERLRTDTEDGVETKDAGQAGQGLYFLQASKDT